MAKSTKQTDDESNLKRFSIWLRGETLAELEAIGKTEDRAIGWLVRKAVESFVENYRPKK